MPKQTIEIEVPEGMRVIDYEFRSEGTYDAQPTAYYRVTFAPAWQPPACLKEAKWFARDEDGEWTAFDGRDVICDCTCWCNKKSGKFLVCEDACQFAGETWTPPVADDVDWKETLTRNPLKGEA